MSLCVSLGLAYIESYIIRFRKEKKMDIPCETCISFAICKAILSKDPAIYLYLHCSIIYEIIIKECQMRKHAGLSIYELPIYNKLHELFKGDKSNELTM